MKLLLACLLLVSTLSSGPSLAADDISTKAYDAALVLQASGRYVEAGKAAQALVAARTQALGAEARETLRARLLLAEALFNLDKDAEAEARLRELLPVVTKVFGAENRETLRCQSGLIATLGSQGSLAEAAGQFRRLIPVETRVLGAEDEETLRARRRLAAVLFHLGKLAEAETEYLQVAALYERVHGAENQVTLQARTALADVIYKQDAESCIAGNTIQIPAFLIVSNQAAAASRQKTRLPCALKTATPE